MFQIIFVVVDRFEIKGKGTALTGITHDDSLLIPVGSDITIKRPGLSDIQSVALGFEVFRNDWSPHKPRNFGILLPASIAIDGVPPKSEIWCDVQLAPNNSFKPNPHQVRQLRWVLVIIGSGANPMRVGLIQALDAMDWIDQLEEEAWNTVVDELVWHLREGRMPTSIHRQFSPDRGVEFKFNDAPTAFFPIQDHCLEDHWDEAVAIISRFPQLQAASIRSGV